MSCEGNEFLFGSMEHEGKKQRKLRLFHVEQQRETYLHFTRKSFFFFETMKRKTYFLREIERSVSPRWEFHLKVVSFIYILINLWPVNLWMLNLKRRVSNLFQAHHLAWCGFRTGFIVYRDGAAACTSCDTHSSPLCVQRAESGQFEAWNCRLWVNCGTDRLRLSPMPQLRLRVATGN